MEEREGQQNKVIAHLCSVLCCEKAKNTRQGTDHTTHLSESGSEGAPTLSEQWRETGQVQPTQTHTTKHLRPQKHSSTRESRGKRGQRSSTINNKQHNETKHMRHCAPV